MEQAMDIYGYITGKYAIDDAKALKAACDQTVEKIEKAKWVWNQANSGNDTVAIATLEKASKALKGTSSAIGKGESLYGAYGTLKRIRAAHKVLSDPHAIRFNREAAIPAMATLINEFGIVASNFPPPANQYGRALQAVAKALGPTVNMLVPQLRKNQAHIWSQLGFSIAAQ
ncbi:hypothetical protein [Novosphingobium sp. PC22D]|uniref:hypothetical protein n=1 Tax=Novosphingobium sp. PC22D TaxID=1962403 RepID=UPI00114586E1|nr:hypothetical protein [Novosphingobium sp. PC22D]